ncbi:MAG: HugZ family protein [Beijerinckiaceae bacterium]
MTMPEIPQAEFDHPGMISGLLTEARFGALGTLAADGAPFTSLVALAKDERLRPVIITSHLSAHTGHMERDARVSLLISDVGKGDPLAHPRLTLLGRATAAHPGEALYDELRDIYLAQNPKAQLYVQLPGFWFWRIEPATVALNGGFGKAWTGPWESLALIG